MSIQEVMKKAVFGVVADKPLVDIPPTKPHIIKLKEQIRVSPVYVAVTINLQRDKMEALDEKGQKRVLLELLYSLKYKLKDNNSPDDYVFDYKYTFERCKSGVFHLHGWVRVITHNMYVKGHIILLVNEFYDYLRTLTPWRRCIRTFCDRDYDSYYDVYKSPMLCLKYMATEHEVIQWEAYINKTI